MDTSQPSSPWHVLSPEEVERRLQSTRQGLSDDEAARRQTIYGRNMLPETPPVSWLVLFLRQFASPLIFLLMGAAGLSVALGDFEDAGFIAIVLLINAVIGTFQEGRAERGAAALNKLVQHQATVIRDGLPRRIDAAELVPGDIIAMESGDQVPADARLLETMDLSVDESLLTGESLPVEKHTLDTVPADTGLAERTTMLHAGSLIGRGRGRAIVVAIGMHTELGRIAAQLGAQHAAPAPLILRLQKFSRVIGIVIVGVVAMLGTAQWLMGMALEDIFFTAVALAVSAIPEGLPIAITVALAVAARRMARRNVIVRSLPTVEGLGACTLIASDKTGTLTRNVLTVQTVWLPDGRLVHLDSADTNDEAVRRLAYAGALCNEARLVQDGDQIRGEGDTVDVAFLRFATTVGLNRPVIVAQEPVVGTIPYESHRKYAAVFSVFTETEGQTIASVKGAAETIIPMCRVDAAAAQGAMEGLAENGFRVLAVARGPVQGTCEEDLHDLELLGLVGLLDPVRPEAPAAVRAATEAGVRVCMVTGDHPKTALAIARTLSISDNPDEVVTGRDLSSAGQDAVRDLACKGRVFARVEPLQKLDIVGALQDAGHFVAVTGDGVNDAPALHKAHIGVAMGKGGTDVARRAADLILTDDNFSSIVAGISEGRVAYDNIRKVIYFLLSTSVAEIGLFVLCLAAGLPMPLFAVQLLWLNLVTDSIQHVALSLERDEADALAHGPRPPGEPLFNRRMLEETILAGMTIAAIGTLAFSWLLSHGYTETEARNLLLLLMVCFENAHVFNCRSETRSTFQRSLASNPWILVVVVLTQAVHIGAMYTPALSDVLGVQPVHLLEWLAVAGLSLSLIAIMETYKLCRRPERHRAFQGEAKKNIIRDTDI